MCMKPEDASCDNTEMKQNASFSNQVTFCGVHFSGHNRRLPEVISSMWDNQNSIHIIRTKKVSWEELRSIVFSKI